ncbi:hypothetical protein [Roseovarius phycicola]|uniref:Uncharacterized protein n=1 Tax=Roseovarius phycicola TaxID=3080976 RepID=A0ABZ2HIJ9_9RHOB
MGLGVALIALCVLCLIASFVFTVPAWINLMGILFGIAGLVMIGKGRKGGGDSA